MNKLIVDSQLFLKRNSSTILTSIGAIGVVATSIMAVKATPKAIKLLEEAKEEKGENLTKLEKVKVAAPVYIPSILIGASSIACIFGANALNKRSQASLMSAYALLDNSYKEYKNKVNDIYGDDADSNIKHELVKDKYEENDISVDDDKMLFLEMISGRYFESTVEEVLLAEYHFNRNFALRGYASLNELYEFLNLPKTDYGDKLGWSMEAGDAFYGYSWVDFFHEKLEFDDGMECCVITMPFEPTPDYEGY